MNKRMDRFLTAAAKQASISMRAGEGGPFGAVIARGSRIVAVASNSVLRSRDATCHAEVNAIRLASKKIGSHLLAGLDIYSTTEPCPMCFSAIHWARLSRVYYSTTIADVKRLGFNELTISNRQLKRWGKSPVRLLRVKNAACQRLLREWQSIGARETY